jgi:acyl carrier protein
LNAIDAIRGFLKRDLRIADAETLDPELPLVQRGVLDSIEVIQVVAFIEREFGITVDETEVLPCNLRTLSAMSAFVARKRAALEAAPGQGMTTDDPPMM